MQIRWLLLAALLFGCQSNQHLGANDPDAAMLTGGDGGSAGSDGGTTSCSCDASSCGSRICGRSECGFACGQCGPGLTCLLGAGCSGGGDSACIDAFGDRVGVLDLGFRACPTDATKQQRCMCNGGGPNDWTSCDPCIEICAQPPSGVVCGAPGCSNGDACCVSIIDPSSLSCGTTCGGLAYTRECDGPEDCTTGSSCCGGSNDAYTTTCTPGGTCGAVEQYCHSTDDCPTAKPHCCPGAIDNMRSCSATDSATCN